MSKFNLGTVVCTRGIDTACKEDADFYQFVQKSVVRHSNGDWGDMTDDDKKMNDDALASNDDRIFSGYIYKPTEKKIWIITEWDGSYTTIMFPDEY